MGSFFSIKQIGNFQRLETFIDAMLHDDLYAALDDYARQGVEALSNATPVRTGETAGAWDYVIERGTKSDSITWTNTHMDDNGGSPVVILLEYGHGTGTGGYVAGYDFINPAIAPIMDNIADGVWKAVVAA